MGFMIDTDHVAGDGPDTCGCSCWECRCGRHATCTAIMPCKIARTCEDCGGDPCRCGVPEFYCEECGSTREAVEVGAAHLHIEHTEAFCCEVIL